MVTVEPTARKDKSGAYWACEYWKYGHCKNKNGNHLFLGREKVKISSFKHRVMCLQKPKDQT